MTLTIEANAASPVPGEGAEVKVMHSAHAQTCVASAASVLVDWCRFVLLAGGPTPPVPPGSPGPHNPNPQPNPVPAPVPGPGQPGRPPPTPKPCPTRCLSPRRSADLMPARGLLPLIRRQPGRPPLTRIGNRPLLFDGSQGLTEVKAAFRTNDYLDAFRQQFALPDGGVSTRGCLMERHRDRGTKMSSDCRSAGKSRRRWVGTACGAIGVLFIACTASVAQTAVSPPGRLLASNCAQCHGTTDTAPGFDSLTGKSASKLLKKLQKYQSGAEGEGIMTRHAMGYTEEQLRQLVQWLSQQR